MSGRTLRYILVGALALAIGIPSVAVGFGEGRTLLLGKRNPSPSRAALSSETQIIASNGTYGTRQSNKKDGDGGGAIYGCRSSAGAEPCIRANNLKGGRAFEFETVGKEAGPHRDRRHHRRAADHQRHRRRHRLQRRQGRRQGGGRLRRRRRRADRRRRRPTERSCAAAGATAAALTNTPLERFRVTFNRDVSTCAYTVSPEGNAAEQAFGVRSPADNKAQVVDRPARSGRRARRSTCR